MLGVVLWSDACDNKAVIWCEDHGNLAYFHGAVHAAQDVQDFDAGDLVQFELTEERHLRYAQNPRRVHQAMYPEIAQKLQDMGESGQNANQPPAARTAEVIEFKPFLKERDRPDFAASLV